MIPANFRICWPSWAMPAVSVQMSIMAIVGCGFLAQPLSANETSQRLLAEALQFAAAEPQGSFEALEKLREATAADPKDAQAWVMRGAYALAEFLPMAALESLDRAATIEPKRANLQFLRGRALQELGRPTAALAAFNREPNKAGNPLYYFYRGLANKEARNYQAALADFDQSDRVLESAWQATQLHRGDVFAAKGKISAAKQAYQLVLSMKPESPVAVTAEARLKILHRR